jgi:hypothetical protein
MSGLLSFETHHELAKGLSIGDRVQFTVEGVVSGLQGDIIDVSSFASAARASVNLGSTTCTVAVEEVHWRTGEQA